MRQAYLLAVAIASAANITLAAERLGPPGMSDTDADTSMGAPAGGAASSPTSEPLPSTPEQSRGSASTNDPNLGSGVLGEPGNPPGTSTAARFERLDIDHDGYISRAEAKKDASLSNKFAGADKNKDGKLSDAEYRNIDQP